MSLADQAYETRRRDLLAADPDWRRDEVRLLDRAYRRYMDARRSRPAGQAAARRAGQREQAAGRRGGQRVLRGELTAQGWPQAWTVEQCRGWQRLGGSLEMAQAVDRAGWNRRDVQRLIDAGQDLSGATVPDGAAREHRQVGDTLADLVLALWPAAPPGALLSIKALWRDGRRERFVILDEPGSRILRSFARGQGGWRSTDMSLPREAPLEQVAADHPELFTVPAGRSVEAWVDPALLGDTAIRDLVTFPGDEGEQAQLWPNGASQQWEDADEEFEEQYPQLPWAHRWVRVNGDRVSALRPAPPTGALVPVLVDEDDFEFLETHSLADYSWFSDAGGAPISWQGGAELADLGSGMLLDRTWGDNDEAPSVGPLPAEADALGGRIADWVTDQQAGPFAALALEQLDPAATLSASDRGRWDRALSGITTFGRCEFDVDDEVLDVVRSLLAQTDEVYRLAAAGLGDPTSRDGTALLAALEDAARQGATGDLQGGNW